MELVYFLPEDFVLITNCAIYSGELAQHGNSHFPICRILYVDARYINKSTFRKSLHQDHFSGTIGSYKNLSFLIQKFLNNRNATGSMSEAPIEWSHQYFSDCFGHKCKGRIIIDAAATLKLLTFAQNCIKLGKDKLRRFAELEHLERVFQPKGLFLDKEHELKGNWNRMVFHNDHPIVLELGCGRGEYTIGLCRKFPENNFVGIDIKGARIWRGAKTSNEEKLLNAAFLRTQIEQIEAFFAPGEVIEIWITFPDPQPQKTRQNRRLTSPRFLAMYRKLLKPGGIVHLKTDNVFFYEYTLLRIAEDRVKIHRQSTNVHGEFPDDELMAIQTTYETKFRAEGIDICYVSFSFQ